MSRPDIPVTISGDSKGFQDALARVRALSKTTASDVMNSFGRIKGLAAGGAGLVTGLVSASSVAVLRDAANAIASVGDEARRAGLDVKSFQELKFVAEQNRVGIDALTDGIKELNLRADEFIVTGGGSAAEAFQRLGYSAEDLKRKLEDPADLFTEIIGRLGDLDKAAQIRVADEVFGGTGGEQFVQLLRLGEEGIRDQIKAANDFGIVMDEELIKRAEEVDRKFNLIATTISTNLKGAIVDAAGAFMSFTDSFREYERQQSSSLRYRQSVLKGAREKALKQRGTTEDDFLSIFGRDSASEIARIDEELKQIEGLLDRRNGIIDKASPGTSPKSGRIKSATDIMRGEMAQSRIEEAFSSTSGGGSSGGNRSTATKEAEKERSAIDDVIASLREELAIIGLTDIERERTIALREAGVEATSKEGQQISALIDEKYRQLAAEEALAEQYERSEEAAERMGQVLDDQLMRIVDGSFDAKEAIAALLSEIINVQTNGKGLFGSLFSEIFGGGGGSSSNFVPTTTLGDFLGYGGARAGGGDVSPGRIYRVNEYEDEFFAPTSHGRIFAPSKLPGASRDGEGGGGRTVVEIVLSKDLLASILEQTGDQTVRIVRSNEEARANYRQNGGEDF
ncbi:phage tail tape measure protein [Sinorhizobium meliloti]|nr:phage tail tape measure protein [Sinorhizobium meliloti]WQP19669.1 phage tail tape measure protein [Sinorhizobium meliloti]WQP33158.1 phage tail tape measure protein [Sinorhizobium meliloti]